MSLKTQTAADSTDDELFESVIDQFTAECRRGARPTVADYEQRYPTLAVLLRELLPTIAAVERVKTTDDQPLAGVVGRPPMPERLGDYRIVREIGYGGMGIVYEAEQQSLGRHVALKILPAQLALDPARVARFEQESRLAASLHHTNIVPVFGVGHDEGMHYYVMQLIDGAGLDRLLADAKDHRLPPARAAEIIRDAARALHAAHEAGTLHRDVKPGNVLIDSQGHVWIADFGLAQVLEAGSGATMQLGGTLRYMPPERFKGVSDVRGDIYGLGATLYEMLSGRPPFDAATSVELLQAISTSEPKPLRQVNADAPRDLETIAAKAMAREPRARYATAGQLAEDLARYLEGRPILARRTTTVERVWRWCKRNRLSAAALAVAVVALVSLTIVSTVGYVQAVRLNDDLNASLVRERDVRGLAETTSQTALDALDRVFGRLAPTDSLAASFEPVSGGGDGTTSSAGALVVPAVSPQIAGTLEDLLPYYLKLAEQRGFDPQVRRQAASAMHRIGMIHGRLGRFDEARDVWSRAAVLLDELQKSTTDDAALRTAVALDAASMAGDLGDLERLRDDDPAAVTAYHRALERLESAGAAQGSFEQRRELGRIHLALGTHAKRGPPEKSPGREGPPRGRPRDGPPPHDRPPPGALMLGGPPPSGPPPFGHPPGGPPFNGPLDRPPLGEGRGNGPPPPSRMGPPEHERPEDDPELHAHLDQAFALLEPLVQERPQDARSRLLLARCRRERAKASADGPLVDRKSPDFAQALALLRALRDEHPTVPDFAFELSETLVDFHVEHLRPEDRPEAEARLDEALKISEALVRDHPQTPAYAAAQVHVYNRLGALLRGRGALKEAEDAHRRALELQTVVAERYPDLPLHQIWRARIAESLSMVLVDQGRTEDAKSVLDAAIAALTPLTESQHAVPGAVPTLRDLERARERAARE